MSHENVSRGQISVNKALFGKVTLQIIQTEWYEQLLLPRPLNAVKYLKGRVLDLLKCAVESNQGDNSKVFHMLPDWYIDVFDECLRASTI